MTNITQRSDTPLQEDVTVQADDDEDLDALRRELTAAYEHYWRLLWRWAVACRKAGVPQASGAVLPPDRPKTFEPEPAGLFIPLGRGREVIQRLVESLRAEKQDRLINGLSRAHLDPEMRGLICDLHRLAESAANGTDFATLTPSAPALSVAAAARELGISETLCRRWARNGDIRGAAKIGLGRHGAEAWTLPADAIADLKENRDARIRARGPRRAPRPARQDTE